MISKKNVKYLISFIFLFLLPFGTPISAQDSFNEDINYFIKIKYKGEEYSTPYNKIALKIKKDYYNDELLRIFDNSEYKVIFTSKKVLSIVLQTNEKVDLLKHYSKFERGKGRTQIISGDNIGRRLIYDLIEVYR
jgi:hypothetical protein